MPLTEFGERKERLGRRVDQDEMMPAVDEPLQHSYGVAADRHALDVEGELLLGEPAGGVVVLERHLGAGDAVILRLDMKARQRDRPLHLLLQIADRHLDHLRRLRCGRTWLVLVSKASRSAQARLRAARTRSVTAPSRAAENTKSRLGIKFTYRLPPKVGRSRDGLAFTRLHIATRPQAHRCANRMRVVTNSGRNVPVAPLTDYQPVRKFVAKTIARMQCLLP